MLLIMTATRLSSLSIMAALLGGATQLHAAIVYDANVTPDTIFGSGNSNGGFAVDENATVGVELGLRAKIRFNEQNQPENIFNSDGAGNYTFVAGVPAVGFGSGSTSTASWSFEWSINSNYNNAGGVLDSFDYMLSIDFNEAEGAEQFLAFDPINVSWADHSTGTNATGNGAGTKAAGTFDSPNPASYDSLISTNNVAQNSWNMEFFDDPGNGFTFNGNDEGEYIIRLEAFVKGTTTNPVASTEIAVQSVPEPTTAGLLLLGLGALAYRRRQA